MANICWNWSAREWRRLSPARRLAFGAVSDHRSLVFALSDLREIKVPGVHAQHPADDRLRNGADTRRRARAGSGDRVDSRTGPAARRLTMGIRDILVLIDREPRPAGAYAIALAQALEANLTAVCLSPEPAIVRYGDWEVPRDVLTQAGERVRNEARKALADFEAAAQLAGVVCESIAMATDPKDPEVGFAGLAGHFDLTVVEQADPAAGTADNELAEVALFGSGRPVLMVPYIQRRRPAFGTVLVAWDGSRASARAVADAMPLLKIASRVEVVTVTNGRSEVDLPGFNIARHLARHGINVELRRLVAGMDVGNTLLSYEADVGADLLVMGGYGHSRLREFILGGATRTIMRTMTLPVLMSH
jgi:nucleotide-binding universal stress UspA family protein